MDIFLKASDVFQFAVRIEEDGELFYRKAAFIADDKEAGKLFEHLAGEEVIHKNTFQKMLLGIDEYRPPETFKGEYLAYLKDYIDSKVVFSKKAKDKELPGVHNTLTAIDFAMQRELDSILFYQEIKQFVPKKEFGLIDKIIEEERHHFAKLSDTKKKYQK